MARGDRDDCPYLKAWATDGHWEVRCLLIDVRDENTDCHSNWEEYRECQAFINQQERMLKGE